MSKMLSKLTFLLGCLMSLNACSSEFITWREEVKLYDGRVITVTQKKQVDGLIARETWITIDIPEFSTHPIEWHENLKALVLNVYAGRLYVVGMPPTTREFGQYGRPPLPYIGFVWEGGQWKRLPIPEIPEQIYNTNMLMEGIPPANTKLLTLAQKESRLLNGNPEYPKVETRINPKTTWNFN